MKSELTFRPAKVVGPDDLYADRDAEALGEHFMRHLDRMTVEGLHSKSAIACELAHRDAKIAALTAERDNALDLWTVAHAERSAEMMRGAEQEAEIAALRQDKARLDWVGLENLNEFDVGFIVDAPHDGEYSIGTEYGVFYGWTLREAIDKAMAQAKAVQPTLICPTCKADRLKEDCKGIRSNCGLKVVAQAVQPAKELP